jgi:hypothetical protein
MWHKKEKDFIQLREEVTQDLIFCSPEKASHWKGVLSDPKIKMWHEKERDFIQLRKEVTKKVTPIALGLWATPFQGDSSIKLISERNLLENPFL